MSATLTRLNPNKKCGALLVPESFYTNGKDDGFYDSGKGRKRGSISKSELQ